MQSINGTRSNSFCGWSELQFSTPRGIISTQVAIDILEHWPAPDERPKPASNYPHRYGNKGEGLEYALFEDKWEVGNATLVAHPVKFHGEPSFDPWKETVKFKSDAAPPGPLARPINQPGPFRLVTDQRHCRIVGAMYHPVGDLSGFARAALEPIDQEPAAKLLV
ncbi:hypothetical protein HYALB_00002439 [Hymenoscyphus albidus]|uniref:Uncharacterized protein n=1 Tax=Hymenoscyphus albidus TaxID=595503 RepID=A0A9N9LVH0_9HELO|nr:hypothetical protein HYALB_00002439 [Hymenoscyphus albidus]